VLADNRSRPPTNVSRQVVLPGGKKSVVFDHSTQFFTASDPRFQALVDKWQVRFHHAGRYKLQT
jgi:hypothetical protein